jgi:GT2 family glycosyltransferase
VLPQHRVTAVVVTHDGARWLPDVLASLAGQVRPAERLVAVDTGSVDTTVAVLVRQLGPADIVPMPRTAGFGAAVKAGLEHVGDLGPRPAPEPHRSFPTGPEDLLADDEDLDPGNLDDDLPEPSAGADWIWLLHDDVAPEPDALLRMLELAEISPSVALIGPKVRDWDDPRLLVEVGLTIDHAGRRETGLERREFDQGQHDAVRDVLAVGTAGCLVRRDVWDALGGLDPRLPIFRDDIDFGWRVNAAGHRVVVVPDARVRHVRAAASGRRRVRCAVGRSPLVDRRHSLAVMLANLSLPGLLLALPRLVGGALLRAAGYLLTRQVHAATDEISALWWNFVRTPQLIKARAARRRHRQVRQRALKHLFAGRGTRLRGYVEAVGDWLSGGAAEDSTIGVDQSADDDNLLVPPTRGSQVAALLGRPVVLMTLGLTALAVVAARDLFGAGALVGGQLLPSPASAGDLWRTYTASWHDVGGGSGAAAPPWLGALAAVATPLLGKAWLAVDLLMLMAVPLAGLSAYAAARRVTSSRLQRVWAGAAYAVLPPVTGAVAAGRLDAVVAAIMAPVIVSACYRAVVRDPRADGWRHAFVAGLALAVGTAFVPQVWALGVVVLLVSLVSPLLGAGSGGRVRRATVARRFAAALIAAAVPVGVLLPWSLELLRNPRLLVSGLTSPTGSEPLRGVDALLLHPGGPGLPPLPFTAGLVLAALTGLLRSGGRRTAAVYCWLVALVALAAAVATTRAGDDAGWPGPALSVAATALIAAALVAAQGVRRQFAHVSFGWRQPTAVLVVALAVAAPIAIGAVWAVRGADDPLDRRPVLALPRYVIAKADREPGLRALWLRPSAGAVRYTVTGLAGGGPADDQLTASEPLRTRLDTIVADLTSPVGSDAAQALATHAVRYVVVPKPVPRAVSGALDAQPSLTRERVEPTAPVLLWRVLAPSGRLTLLSGAAVGEAARARGPSLGSVRSSPAAVLVPARGADRVAVPAGPPGRLLVLGEQAGTRWSARVDGRRLPTAVAWGWAQAFEVPAEASVVTVSGEATTRRTWLAVQVLALLVALVFAAPAIRRSEEVSDVVDTEAEEPRVLEPAAAGAA